MRANKELGTKFVCFFSLRPVSSSFEAANKRITVDIGGEHVSPLDYWPYDWWSIFVITVIESLSLLSKWIPIEMLTRPF